MIALLDVSVLLALFDPDSVHHDAAHDWFDEQRHEGWASCPITENGFVRLVTRPTFANPPHRVVDVVTRLIALKNSSRHEFWPESLSLADDRVFSLRHIQGPKQLTDVYLLALATANGGTLATFDRSVHLGAVKGAARANLMILSAVPEESTAGGN